MPIHSDDPLLAFRCVPAVRPYLAEDISASLLIDSPVIYSQIIDAKPINLGSTPQKLGVTVTLDGKALAKAMVPLNATAYEVPFSLLNIQPQPTSYNITCEATYTATDHSAMPQSFSTSTTLYVLPDPSSGSVTKMDLRTGALLAKPATGNGGNYEPVFPIGFYTQFDGYLTNLSVINELKDQG